MRAVITFLPAKTSAFITLRWHSWIARPPPKGQVDKQNPLANQLVTLILTLKRIHNRIHAWFNLRYTIMQVIITLHGLNLSVNYLHKPKGRQTYYI